MFRDAAAGLAAGHQALAPRIAAALLEDVTGQVPPGRLGGGSRVAT